MNSGIITTACPTCGGTGQVCKTGMNTAADRCQDCVNGRIYKPGWGHLAELYKDMFDKRVNVERMQA